MKRNSLITLMVFLLGLFFLVTPIFAAEKKIDKIKITNRLISIRDVERAKPATLTSTPGTTVIWVNHSRFPIEILFLDKKVVLACGAPVNFFVGKDGAYESSKIPSGATASLCFMEKGKYEYKVKSSTTFYVGRIKRGHQGVIQIK
jgi:plastocyanin